MIFSKKILNSFNEKSQWFSVLDFLNLRFSPSGFYEPDLLDFATKFGWPGPLLYFATKFELNLCSQQYQPMFLISYKLSLSWGHTNSCLAWAPSVRLRLRSDPWVTNMALLSARTEFFSLQPVMWRHLFRGVNIIFSPIVVSDGALAPIFRLYAGRKTKFAPVKSLRFSELFLGILLSKFRFTVFLLCSLEWNLNESPTAVVSNRERKTLQRVVTWADEGSIQLFCALMSPNLAHCVVLLWIGLFQAEK